MAQKGKISDREQALIAAARRELAARPAPGSGPHATATPGVPAAAPPPAPGPAAVTGNRPVQEPPVPAVADKAMRIAALMAAERAEIGRRRKRLRQWGIYVPMVLFAATLLWFALFLPRQGA